MSNLNITGFGEELSDIKNDNFIDWLIAYRKPIDIWNAHTSFVLCESVYIIGGLLIFCHALKQGGRWPFFCLATICHSLTVEFMAYFFPHIDNFWHAQGVFTLFDRRMPIYILFLYVVFYYHSTWAVSKMKLKSQIAEHLAIGILTVLIDMPYDIVGVKWLHWVWHDTDPNIAERTYWVPWNSYYFHACFSASFQFFYHSSRKWFDRRNLDKWERGTIKSELLAVIIAGLMGMPGGCLLFIPLYHPLHDFYNVSSEVTTLTILIIFVIIVWKFDRKSNRYEIPKKMDFLSKILIVHLICHYATWLYTAIFINPANVISIGVHQRTGDCKLTTPVETILKTLEKKTYLCTTDYDEKYFDFHCLKDGKPPNDNSLWYTICGTDIENKVELVAVLFLISFVALMVFKALHFDYDQNVSTILKSVDYKNLNSKNEKDSKKIK